MLHLKVLEIFNRTTIAKLLDKSLHILWCQGIKHDNILLFLSGSALYTIKADKSIKITYFEMEHVNCLTHGLYRIAEEIQKHFPKIDQLISNIKKVFLIRLFSV